MNPFLVRRIRGPVFLLCFAVTALLAQWHVLSFAQSWPFYLLTAGILRLLESALPVSIPAGYSPLQLPRRRSVTGGLSLLFLGVVALLLTNGALDAATFWPLYARWWPLLLIALGLLLLVERIFDRSYTQRVATSGYALPPRRGSGLVFLVLLLVALGLTSRASRFFPLDTQRWGDHWQWNWDDALGGDARENEITLDQPIPSDATLSIDNARGDVQIAPSTDGHIHVAARQAAHVSAREQARAFSNSRPVLAIHGGEATLTVPTRPRVSVSLSISLPPTVTCTVRTHHGDIAVSGLTRPLVLAEDHGDVTLDNLGASAQLQMDHGDVRARTVAGDLTLDGRADDVSLSGIRGKTTLRGEFFGDTQLDNAAAPVSFHSNRTTLDIQHLAGTLSLDGENLRITDPSGGLELQTRSKEVEITGLAGPATVEDSNSDMRVTLATVTGPVSLRNNTGNITLAVPATGNYSLTGSTGPEDEITSEFPFAQSTGGGMKTIQGRLGAGGPALELHTTHGDLTVHRATPGKPERHLHAEGEPPAPVAQ